MMDYFNYINNEYINNIKRLLTLSGLYDLLNLDNILIDFKSFFNVKFEDDEEYMNYLYAHKWHPYTGYHLDYKLKKYIMQIKRTISDYQLANLTIDKTIFHYYDKNTVKSLKIKWRKSVNDYRKRVLLQSLSAFNRYEYALTICALVPMWTVFINNICNADVHNVSDIKAKYNKIMSDKNYSAIYNEYFDNFIFYKCKNTSEVVADVPGRHAIAHGYFTDYPSKKSALNAIIFTDLLINLENAKS
ncbi:MAG: hypothetical protein K2O89_01255 [Clostridia bacterium]|nr:hypothetical protein [Clostridia bacterium]